MNSLRPALLVSIAFFLGCAHAPATASAPGAHAASPTPAISEPPRVVSVTTSTADELEQALQHATLYFDFNSGLLTPASMETLQRVAHALVANHGAVIRIEGNCDERGTEEYNLALGQQRAEAARKYLVSLGVTTPQLSTVSYGALRPAAAGHSEDDWQKNRRDDLRAQK